MASRCFGTACAGAAAANLPLPLLLLLLALGRPRLRPLVITPLQLLEVLLLLRGDAGEVRGVGGVGTWLGFSWGEGWG